MMALCVGVEALGDVELADRIAELRSDITSEDVRTAKLPERPGILAVWKRQLAELLAEKAKRGGGGKE